MTARSDDATQLQALLEVARWHPVLMPVAAVTLLQALLVGCGNMRTVVFSLPDVPQGLLSCAIESADGRTALGLGASWELACIRAVTQWVEEKEGRSAPGSGPGTAASPA